MAFGFGRSSSFPAQLRSHVILELSGTSCQSQEDQGALARAAGNTSQAKPGPHFVQKGLVSTQGPHPKGDFRSVSWLRQVAFNISFAADRSAFYPRQLYTPQSLRPTQCGVSTSHSSTDTQRAWDLLWQNATCDLIRRRGFWRQRLATTP